MLRFIDDFLNKITMYRLVLYYLLGLFAVAVVFGAVGILPYPPGALIASAAVITAAALVTNGIFAKVYRAHTNVESVYITALILALIVPPLSLFPIDLSNIAFYVWIGIWAMGAKYIFAVGKKHIFNPAAFAVALTSFTIAQSADWWVGGNLPLLVFVLIGGLLIVRKLRRGDMIWAFFGAGALSIFFTNLGASPFSEVWNSLLHSPMFFFAFVMLTEPLTTPPTRVLRVLYGGLVGILFAPSIHIGSLYSTPELALLAGNVFSYAVSPKWKEVLTLRKKEEIGKGIYEFVFKTRRKLEFRPGQYLEWTLGHKGADGRGNRRYFTVASSPTERDVRMGVKFYENPSTFKKTLMSLRPGDTIAASQLSGDFTLPKDKGRKLAFLAGGIGITPFRSMVKYLLDTGEDRDVTLVYSVKSPKEFVYSDVFEEAYDKLKLNPVYVVSDPGQAPPDWKGPTGFVNEEMLRREIPDFRERMFYVSGTHAMVSAYERILREMGVSKSHIKTDFFPGFA